MQRYLTTRFSALLALSLGALLATPAVGQEQCTYLYTFSMLLEQIQFYNSQGYHCDPNSESGWSAGPGEDYTCVAPFSDYNPQDFVISLPELLRQIQFYNTGVFHFCPVRESEDGFCPGLGDSANGCEPLDV